MARSYRCYQCNRYRPETAFYRDATRYNGRSSRCKDCGQTDHTAPVYQCYQCEKEKPPTEFYRDASRFNGRSSRCIACEKERDRVRRRKPKRN